MRQRRSGIGILLALALVSSACASIRGADVVNYFGISLASATPTAVDTPTATEAPAAADTPGPSPTLGPNQIGMVMNPRFGPILIGSNGMTLYMRLRERTKGSTCYRWCAKLWPPVLISGSPIAGSNLDGSKLGTTTRTDGTIQATYNGYPLYYYSGDKEPGDTNGEGWSGLWFVAGAVGQPVRG